jgi:ribosomal 30S subunit maturation factor RimM
MDTNTLDALSGLEIAIRESVKMAKQDDEFTVHDFITRAQSNGQILSYNAAGKRLIRMVEKKLLKFRILPIDGYRSRVYSAY